MERIEGGAARGKSNYSDPNRRKRGTFKTQKGSQQVDWEHSELASI